MEKLFIFVLVTISIVMISGCKESNPLQPSPNKVAFYPLTKGNTWTYLYAEYDSSGSIFVSDTVTAFVGGDSTIWGRQLTFRWFECDGWLANTDSGLIAYLGWNSKPPTNTFILEYQYPTAKGNFYYTSFLNMVDVGSIDTLITVPAGTFHCIQYHSHEIGSPLWADSFVSPGIGLIKTAVYNSYAPSRIYDGHQLLSYSLK